MTTSSNTKRTLRERERVDRFVAQRLSVLTPAQRDDVARQALCRLLFFRGKLLFPGQARRKHEVH